MLENILFDIFSIPPLVLDIGLLSTVELSKEIRQHEGHIHCAIASSPSVKIKAAMLLYLKNLGYLPSKNIQRRFKEYYCASSITFEVIVF